MSCSAVTLLVPTKNRSDFLSRLFRYYHEQGFDGVLGIANSSRGSEEQKVRELVERYGAYLNIDYYHVPEMSQIRATLHLAKNIKTPFVAELQDDNFLIPESIKRCIRFLEEHPDYSAATGLGISLKTFESQPFGPITKCVKMPQPDASNASSEHRFLELMSNYSDVHFSVMRKNTYQRFIRGCDIEDPRFFQSLASCIVVIEGRVKRFPGLHLVRQMQDEPYRAPEYGPLVPWLLGENWGKHQKIFKDMIADALSVELNVDSQTAEKVLHKGMQLYLLSSLAGEVSTDPQLELFSDRIFQSGVLRVRLNSRRHTLFRIVRHLTNKIDQFLIFSETKCLRRRVFAERSRDVRGNWVMAHLLDKQSEYYESFEPIFRLITQGQRLTEGKSA